MGRRLAQGSEERFAAYVEELASVIGHADRVAPLDPWLTACICRKSERMTKHVAVSPACLMTSGS